MRAGLQARPFSLWPSRPENRAKLLPNHLKKRVQTAQPVQKAVKNLATDSVRFQS